MSIRPCWFFWHQWLQTRSNWWLGYWRDDCFRCGRVRITTMFGSTRHDLSEVGLP